MGGAPGELSRGAAGCRPLIARESLAASLIEPALALLARHGVEPAFGHRLRAIERDGRALALDFVQGGVALGDQDRVIVALPPGQAGAILPEIAVPEGSHPIVNGHFRLPQPLPGRPVLLGLIGGTAQWLFLRADLVSLTVSAADALAEEPAEAIAERLWADTAKALDLPASPRPPGRIVKERRATFAQTPGGGRGTARRPHALAQSLSRRRLDRDRPAGDHRRGDPLRTHRGRPLRG